MVEKVGEYARSYWPVVSGIVLAAVAWGVMYEKLDATQTTLAKLDGRFDQVVSTVAANTEHGHSTDQRIADAFDRIRALETARH